MGSAWTAADVLKQNRLNRAWILGRALAPLYDVDNSDVVTVTAKALDGALLAATVGTLYTAPATAGSVAQVHSITVRNTDSTARAVNLYLVPSGGSVGVPEQIFADTVQPGETVVMEPKGGWFLGASGTIRGSAAAASVVALRAEVSEYSAQPGGLTLKVINGVQLGVAYSTIYTVPASGVTHALLLHSTLCNTDSVSRAPTVTIVESGDTSSVEDEIFGDTLVAKETVLDDTPRVLEPSDFIQAKCAAAANVVACRLTVLEAA